MRVQDSPRGTNPALKNAFYSVTRELDSSLPLSRAVVDLFGCDIPWVLMANNKEEKKEKARKLSAVFSIAWLSPFVTLPFSNRFAMKYVGKLTNKFWSNNHKAIHISNEFLKNSDDMMNGLRELAKKTTRGPLETLYNKVTKSSYKQEIDVDALLKSCGGDKEKLRNKLIKSKNAVLFSDCIFTFGTIGSFVFLNNEITSKESGQKGFSAELSMADKAVIEKRAQEYERNKRIKFAAYGGLVALASFGLSLASYGALISKSGSKFISKLKDRAKNFDYVEGIYMKRLPLVTGSLVSQVGYMLASRNNTEKKDNAIRYGLSDAVFFGGDLALASLLYNASDKLFKTNLTKNQDGKNSLLKKTKSIKEIINEVEAGKIKPKNKIIASSVFWFNLAVIAVSMGYIIPKFVNRMIKKDVQKDATLGTQKFISPKTNLDNFLNKKRTQ